MNPEIRKKIVKTAVTVLLCVIAVYGLVYIDVVMRARSAYLEGEKYLSWHENPSLKKAEIEKKYEKERQNLEKRLNKDKITKDEYEQKMQVLGLKKSEQLRESSVKYAYIWYQTAVELFSPPESKWVKLSREKMEKAKDMWKKELRAKKIPFEDYMIE
ncbi:MAG: hypothetical protein JW803_01030 [Endomicrobiales bacterium]|nr:hypothetical protein [Endomicrobiales bacterium]